MDPRPDVLLVTGDVADHGLPEEYAEARAVLDAWPGPSSSAPATTTSASEFARGLLDREADGPLVEVLEAPAFRILDARLAGPGAATGSGSTTASSPPTS